MDWKRWRSTKKRELPADLWMRCPDADCGATVFKKAVEAAGKVCPECNYHFTLDSGERIELLLDEDSFCEHFTDLRSLDPLSFNANAPYPKKLAQAQQNTGLSDAAVVGTATLEGIPLVIGVTDPTFMMGSMGSVVGERLTRGIELAHERGLPLVICCGSGGGARMQEGVLSLFQMAKTSAALARYRQAGGVFISLLTHATMGGAMASFASLGDLILAEPKALLGFAGPRVIMQTIRKELPKGFQTSEFMLEHGFVDRVVNRVELRDTLAKILTYCPPVRLSGRAG